MSGARVVEEARSRGVAISLGPGGGLRIGPTAALTPSLRAQVLMHRSEIVAALKADEAAAAEAYERDDRVWAATYVTHMARAEGYDEELVETAATLVAKRRAGSSFRVGADVIVIEMTSGCTVRIHRLTQPWTADECAQSPRPGDADP